MTNKGKVLAAVIAVVVVLAGGVGLYLKGGDLMGKISKPKTPVVKEVSVCPSGETVVGLYADTPIVEAVYHDFASFYNSVLAVKQANGGQLDCPYRFDFKAGQDDPSDTVLFCEKNEVFAYEQNGTKSVRCYKNMKGLGITADISQNEGGVFGSVKYFYETDYGSVIQTLYQYSYNVAKVGKTI